MPTPDDGRRGRAPGALLAALLLLTLGACASPTPPGFEQHLRVDAEPPAGPADSHAVEAAVRRQRLGALLGEPGLVLLRAPAWDESERFFQSDDLWYLTGVDLPDIGLALVLGPEGELQREVLFLPEKDTGFERWNGPRLAPGPGACTVTGLSETRALPADGDGWIEALAELGAEGTWFTPRDEALAPPEGLEPDPQGRLTDALASLRLVKSEYELACLQTAIDITGQAILQALAEVEPGLNESAIQAAIDGTYLRLGSERPGFPSICASGPNTCTLHYDRNDRQLEDGDLLLMDVGAKYRYYCADISRTVPVNGRFTPRQREIYELVLAAQTAAAEAARPGMTIRDLHLIAQGVLAEAGYDRYFFHGVGHWLGLDVHDVGGRVPIEVGSVFTIEPGVYLADEQLGVRIEDDYLMTAEGAVRLSTTVPSDPDELEALLASLH